MDYIEMNKHAYNTVADLFSSTREYLWDDLKALGSYVHEHADVLDVGCGNGRLYELFSTKSVQYTGIDQSESLITLAQKKVSQGRFFVHDISCELPFEVASFDVLYCIAVFCHIPPAQHIAVLSHMKQVLRPGGYIIMTNWNAYNNWVQEKVSSGKYKTDDQKNFIVPWRNGPGDILATRYYYGFKDDELKKLFEHVGFRLVDQYYTKKGERVDITTGENIVSIVQLDRNEGTS